MRCRHILAGAVPAIFVLALAAYSLWIILLRMRPLDPEMLRAPGFSQTEMFDAAETA